MLLAAVGAVVASGCASVPLVDFTRAPALSMPHPEDRAAHGPSAPWARQWREVRDRWARRAHVTNDWDTALDAQVVLASAEVRAAYVRFLAGLRGYSDDKRNEVAAQHQADGEAFVEALVAMQTSKWEWNDLTSSRSVWSITFSDDAGHTVEAVERSQIAQKTTEFAEVFAEVTPFTMAWRVRFPSRFSDGTPLLTAASRKVSLRFVGPLGESTVRWEADR